MKQLVLASSSAGRRQLLERLGVTFTVDPSEYEEDMTLNMPPIDLAIHLSQGKARAVAKRHKNAIVIGADSFVVLGKELLGKPHTPKRAKEMLANLSGKTHSFITGFTVIDTATGKEKTGSAETVIEFKPLTKEQIARYITSEDVLSKAGAYAMHGRGATFVRRIDGECSNVTGLPLGKLADTLAQFGVDLFDF